MKRNCIGSAPGETGILPTLTTIIQNDLHSSPEFNKINGMLTEWFNIKSSSFLTNLELDVHNDSSSKTVSSSKVLIKPRDNSTPNPKSQGKGWRFEIMNKDTYLIP
jgi:hypothetical protein